MSDHKSLLAFRFALTHKHGLKEGKDFTLKPKIGGGKVLISITFINRDPDEYSSNLKAVALVERCDIELKRYTPVLASI